MGAQDGTAGRDRPFGDAARALYPARRQVYRSANQGGRLDAHELQRPNHHGTDLATFLDELAARGLTPVEVTADEFVQTIHITHDASSGQFSWKAERLDGIQAVGL